MAEERIRRELRFDPEGDDDGQPPASFRLTAWNTPQRRDGRAVHGWASTGPPEITVLAEGITRQEMAQLIERAADELVWDGKG